MCLGFRSSTIWRSGPSDADVDLQHYTIGIKALMVRFHSFETLTVRALILMFGITGRLLKMNDKGFKVGIIMGSKSDLSVMKLAADTLEEFGVDYEMRIMSAHRTP